MKITADNYKSFFTTFNGMIEEINPEGNRTVMDALNELKEEFEKKERGSDILLADNSVLKIGIVGQVKAGKSSFLNSLFFDGENILPRASTPMTAGLTVLKYSEENKFIVEYFNKKEWQYFEDKAAEYDKIIQMGKAQNPGLTDDDIEKMYNIDETKRSAKEMVDKCSRAAKGNVQEVSKKEEKPFTQYTDLQNILEDYVGANGKLTSIVKCLTLELNDQRLKGVQIVDTPGVNDPVLSREMRTREFLQECHGVFFLSNSTSFFGATDVNFLVNRIGSQGIGTVVLIGSMLDAGLMDASGKYHDDLGNALDYVRTSLERQYQSNIESADFNGDDPILDFNSGIGYSIAKKGRSRWDAMEAHVVERMKELYPSFFDTDENIKEMFSALANIDGEEGIRAKYLDGLFKENMDKIIRQKLDSYFNNASAEMSKAFDKQKTTLSDQLKALKECENPEERRQTMLNLVKQMKGDIVSIISRVDNRAEKAVKEVMNSFSLNWDGRVPTMTIDVNCKRETTFWNRNKEFNVNVEVVDTNALANNVIKLITDSLKKVSDTWNKKNSELTLFISDAINDFISEQEKNDTGNNIDGKMLNTILKETLDEMSNEATIDVASIINKAQSDVPSALMGYDEVSGDIGEASESEARSRMSQRARDNKNLAASEMRDYLSTIFPEIQNKVKKASRASVSCITDKKDVFTEHIATEINKKVDELEAQIKDRTKNLAILDAAIIKLNEIQSKL